MKWRAIFTALSTDLLASVGELQGVQEMVCDGFEVGQHKALKRLHHHRGQGNGSVVIKSCGPWLFRDRNDGGGLEAIRYMASLQRNVENVCEHRRQLIRTVLQGGWRDRDWPGCFGGGSAS